MTNQTSVKKFCHSDTNIIQCVTVWLLIRLVGMDSYNSPTTRPLFRASQIVWYFLGIIETLLVFRFFLKLLSANPEAGFSDFIYNLSYIFVVPFQTVFQTSQVAGSIFEWTTLLAIFVYWLVGVGIMRILAMSKTVSTPEAAEQLEREGV